MIALTLKQKLMHYYNEIIFKFNEASNVAKLQNFKTILN